MSSPADDRQLTVLQLHTRYREHGGEDVAVATEADLLRQAGHSVVQRIASNPDGTREALSALATSAWNPRAARAVDALVDDHGPDVASVHNTWFRLSPSVVVALGRRGVPVVLWLHNYRLLCAAGTLFNNGAQCHDCIGGSPWRAVAHSCYRDSAILSGVAAATVSSWHRSGAIDAVTRFVVMTEAGRDIFVAGGLPADKIVVRPHGLPDPGVTETRPSDSDTLLFVGRAVEEKGIGMLLDWWGQRPRSLSLDIVGDGPVLDQWRGNLPDGVTVHGQLPRPRVLQKMRAARAVVVPSIWDEPFGLVAVEAMACGVGVLSTGLGGLADIHGPDGGWVAPPGDHSAWDAALDSMTDRAVDAAGRAARARYLANYTSEHASRSLLSLFADIAAA